MRAATFAIAAVAGFLFGCAVMAADLVGVGPHIADTIIVRLAVIIGAWVAS